MILRLIMLNFMTLFIRFYIKYKLSKNIILEKIIKTLFLNCYIRYKGELASCHSKTLKLAKYHLKLLTL
jgi:hypothetical protein